MAGNERKRARWWVRILRTGVLAVGGDRQLREGDGAMTDLRRRIAGLPLGLGIGILSSAIFSK